MKFLKNLFSSSAKSAGGPAGRYRSDTARYRGFYDADLAESVRRRYARDIELFGYEF